MWSFVCFSSNRLLPEENDRLEQPVRAGRRAIMQIFWKSQQNLKNRGPKRRQCLSHSHRRPIQLKSVGYHTLMMQFYLKLWLKQTSVSNLLAPPLSLPIRPIYPAVPRDSNVSFSRLIYQNEGLKTWNKLVQMTAHTQRNAGFLSAPCRTVYQLRNCLIPIWSAIIWINNSPRYWRCFSLYFFVYIF